MSAVDIDRGSHPLKEGLRQCRPSPSTERLTRALSSLAKGPINPYRDHLAPSPFAAAFGKPMSAVV
jgi:hypothetical protein